jgi:hypothetical protein
MENAYWDITVFQKEKSDEKHRKQTDAKGTHNAHQ